MPKLFSIVICTFNRANLLPRALDSLLAQSAIDWDAIVVDDGSTDATEEVVLRYTRRCSKITYFKRMCNRGIAAARNIGVAISRGQYVTFLDSDDEYAIDHLATRKEILRRDTSIGFLHGGLKIIGNPFVVHKDDNAKRIHLNKCAVGGTFFVRRDVFSEIGGFDDLTYAEDASFLEKSIREEIKVHKVDHPTYFYYRNVEGQLTELHAARIEQDLFAQKNSEKTSADSV